MANATLQQIVQKCIANPEFFESLVRDVNTTLRKADLALSDPDLNTLRRMVSNVKPPDVNDIVEIVNRFTRFGREEWRPGWPAGWVP